MAFPDDYRRVQIAGGIKTDVDVHIGLPRQLIIDATEWNIRLLDGVTEGGHKVLMEKDLGPATQLPGLIGSSLQIARGTDAAVDAADQTDKTARLWKAGTLKNFFSKFVDVTMNENNNDFTVAVKNDSLRASLRTNIAQVADLNQVFGTGWYRFDPAAVLNAPADYPNNVGFQGMMMVMAQTTNELYQLVYIRDGTQRVWGRHRNAGEWGNWGLVAGITQSDLDKYLKLTGGVMTNGFTIEKEQAGRLQGIRVRNKGVAANSDALMQFAAKNRDFDSNAHAEFGQLDNGNGFIRVAGHTFEFKIDGSIVIDGAGGIQATGDVPFSGTMATKYGASLDKAIGGFESSPQSWVTGGNVTVAHGLGLIPKNISIIAVVTQAFNGWLVGDRIMMSMNQSASDNNYTTGEGYVVSADATSVKLSTGVNGMNFIAKNGGHNTRVGAAYSNFIIVARP